MSHVSMASTMMSARLWGARFSPFTIKLNCNLSCSRFSRSQSTSIEPENQSEYSESPEYPPIFDLSLHGRARLRRQVQYDVIQALPTVEEKLLQFCLDKEGVQKKLNFMVTMNEIDQHYNLLGFKLFATKTSLKEGLPEVYSRMNVDALAEHIKPVVLNAILNTYDGTEVRKPLIEVEEKPADRLRRQDRRRGQQMTDSIFRAVTTVLSSRLPHLRDCQVDYLPRCDAFWLAGGFAPSTYTKKLRTTKKYGAMTPEDAPVDVRLQYTGKPYLQLRNTQPLPLFVDRDDSLCTTYDVPEYKYQSTHTGLRHLVRCPTNVPGFWPGDPHGFGSLAVFTTEKLRNLTEMFGEDSCENALHSCGVVSSFAWLVALAHFKGFTIHHELTYPLTTQTVLTNGKHWSFYAYQLNTMCLHEDFYTKQYQNICWTTNGMKLFDTVENGKVVGYNDEVVKLIIKFLANAPEERVGVNLTPYLQAVERSDDTDWTEIYRKFKRFYAGLGPPTPYGPVLWETIYKVKFNTRLE